MARTANIKKVTGVGYAPEGQIISGAQPVTMTGDRDLHLLLTAASLCNNSRLLPPDPGKPALDRLG